MKVNSRAPNGMAYRHDIFVSYWRDPQALVWISRFLNPMLSSRVAMALGRRIDIYVHEVTDQIPVGVAWPVDLGETIAHSRILIAIWSRGYLSSEWCRQELSIMLDRESKTGARTIRNKYGLIIPIVVQDGETIPKKLSAQRLEAKDYYNEHMVPNGDKAEKFGDLLTKHAEGIAAAIERAPKWQRGWPQKAARKLLNAYSRQQPSQRIPPRFNPR
jgi:hypothetical protein